MCADSSIKKIFNFTKQKNCLAKQKFGLKLVLATKKNYIIFLKKWAKLVGQEKYWPRIFFLAKKYF